MKTIYCILILSTLWLIPFAAPCPAQLQEFYPPDEVSDFLTRLDDSVQIAYFVTPSEMPPAAEVSEVSIADPLEPVNRAFFNVNDRIYFWALKPVASGYKAIAPEQLRVGVRNFFSNVTTPIRLVNCLLQAQFKDAGNEVVRLLMNSTFGLAGFLDPAKDDLKIEKKDRDLGQTFGVWGIGPAFYINWPILGPSSLRDTAGYAGDLFLDPVNYLALPISLGIKTYDQINETSLRIGDYEDLKKAALDPYVALRNAYYQYRQAKIKEK